MVSSSKYCEKKMKIKNLVYPVGRGGWGIYCFYGTCRWYSNEVVTKAYLPYIYYHDDQNLMTMKDWDPPPSRETNNKMEYYTKTSIGIRDHDVLIFPAEIIPLPSSSETSPPTIILSNINVVNHHYISVVWWYI